MATIGTFMKSGDSFTGAVKTLSISAKTTIKPADKASDKAPDYRIFANQVEFGAAWKKTSGEGREYLSVKLDDPSFPAPIYATLIEGEEAGNFNLIWSRRKRRLIAGAPRPDHPDGAHGFSSGAILTAHAQDIASSSIRPPGPVSRGGKEPALAFHRNAGRGRAASKGGPRPARHARR